MRPPRTHIKALTYKEKIPGVLNGTILQTIRTYLRTEPEKVVKPGDFILFHGWQDKPYRSPWSWRLKVEASQVNYGTAYQDRIYIIEEPGSKNVLNFFKWESPEADLLAAWDGIKPATGPQLKKTLETLNGNITIVGVGIQIIRWSWPPLDFEIRGCHYAEWDNEKPDFNKYLSEAPSC
jgi:hypothetical protein